MTNKEEQEVIRSVFRAYINDLKAHSTKADRPTFKILEEVKDNAIKALEQTRWIPVSERLPEKQITIGKYVFSEYVLGTEGYTIRRAYYNYTTKEWFDGNEEMEWTEITHWMPLPEETPKAESEDEK